MAVTCSPTERTRHKSVRSHLSTADLARLAVSGGSPAGSPPIPVSSGRTDRHRGGDRQTNSALWRIALVRMGCHQPTRDYVARRTAEGKTKTEIMRCLKRYIAREVFPHLLATAPGQASDNCEPVSAGLSG
jgi:hypothetical protein